MLNPVWLKTFVTLIDTGHFTKTAEKLFMTQPGVTQHIHKLESACGHALIKREKKSFVITEQGRLVYRHAKELALNEKKLIEHLAFDDPYTGECSLACSGSAALLLYPEMLNLQLKYPNLVMKLKAAPNHQVLSDIREGDIDQGIVTDIPDKKLFDAIEIGKEELCLVVPSNYMLEGNIVNSLMKLGLISHPDAEHYLALYFDQSKDSTINQIEVTNIPIVGFVNQISQILQPVSQGIGFTILPRSVIDSFHQKHLLSVIESKHSVIETLYLIKKKNRELPARYTTFNTIIECGWAS